MAITSDIDERVYPGDLARDMRRYTDALNRNEFVKREREAERVIRQLDDAYMAIAIDEARGALLRGDTGYGCVVVHRNRVVGYGSGSEKPTDCTCHSEVIAIREAQRSVGGLLQDCWLYSTFEPCVFCIGAICHSKVSRVIWGAERKDLPHLYRQRNHCAQELLADTGSPPHCRWGILRGECIEVTIATPERQR